MSYCLEKLRDRTVLHSTLQLDIRNDLNDKHESNSLVLSPDRLDYLSGKLNFYLLILIWETYSFFCTWLFCITVKLTHFPIMLFFSYFLSWMQVFCITNNYAQLLISAILPHEQMMWNFKQESLYHLFEFFHSLSEVHNNILDSQSNITAMMPPELQT